MFLARLLLQCTTMCRYLHRFTHHPIDPACRMTTRMTYAISAHRQHMFAGRIYSLPPEQVCACLQQSIPDQGPPPLPQLHTALKKGFLAYEERRNSLLSQAGIDATSSSNADAAAVDCFDKHEKCSFWASIASLLSPCLSSYIASTIYLGSYRASDSCSCT